MLGGGGVDAPLRIREEAELQVFRHREWTPEEWADYAARLAEVSYVDGYRAGLEEGAELAPARRPLGQPVEASRRGWSLWQGHPSTLEVLRRRGDPGDPLAGVPAAKASEFLEQLEASPGTYLIRPDRQPGVIVEDEDKT